MGATRVENRQNNNNHGSTKFGISYNREDNPFFFDRRGGGLVELDIIKMMAYSLRLQTRDGPKAELRINTYS